VAEGRYPGILLFSEIFQVTGPIRRTAALLAGHGFIVAVPEIYHEYEPAGTALAYDTAGADRGNALKTTKPLEAYDADARAVLKYLAQHPQSTGKLGVMGICIGGHLAFRAAMNPEVLATTCFYATDIHKRGLGAGMNDDTLDRIHELQGEMLMIWGRQDPHVPPARGPPEESRGDGSRGHFFPMARSEWRPRLHSRRRATLQSGARAAVLRA